ncbi:MAG: CHAT domain-containing protein [Bacteroidales bacterium]|nr:CHAT domain-containing protein [Bacteroidales bacterium]
MKSTLKTIVFLLFLIFVPVDFLSQQNPLDTEALILLNNAKSYEKEGKTDSAIIAYIQASNKYRASGNHYEYARCLVCIGSLHKDRRDPISALIWLNKADSVLKKSGVYEDSLNTALYHLRGTANYINGSIDKAIMDLQASADLKLKLYGPKDTNLSITYNNLGVISWNQEKYDKAIDYYEKAIESASSKRVKNNDLLPKFRENIGILYGSIGDYNKSREYLRQALNDKLNITTYKDNDLAHAYQNLGNLELLLSNYDLALQYLIQAENLYIKAHGSEFPDLDIVYLNMGKVYNLRSDYEKALNYYNRALGLLRKKNPNHPRINDVLQNIGYIHFSKSEYEQAADYFKLCIFNDPNSSNTIKSYRNLAKCYQFLKMDDAAENNFQKSILLSNQLLGNNHAEVAFSKLNYGEYLVSKGKTQEGLKKYYEALKIQISQFGQKNRDVADCYIKIGTLYLDEKNYAKALQNFQAAIISLNSDFNVQDPAINPIISTQMPDYFMMFALSQKAETYYRMWQKSQNSVYLENSDRTFNTFSLVLDNIRSGFTYDESNIQVSGHFKTVLLNAIRTLVSLHQVTGKSSYLEDAFRYAEKSKSSLLFKEVQDFEEGTYGLISQELIQMERDLKKSVAGYKKLVTEENALIKPSTAKLELWNEKIFENEKQLDTLYRQIKEYHPEYYSRRFGNKGIQMSEIQQKLNNEIILEYSITDSDLFIFAVTNDTFTVFDQKIDPNFQDHIGRMVSNLKAVNSDDPSIVFQNFVQSSSYLYDKLILPINPLIGNKKIIVVPDGILAYIPFETLIKSKPTDLNNPDYSSLSYLIQTNCIRYSYLASILFFDRAPKNNNLENLVAFAPVDFNNFYLSGTSGQPINLPPLYGSEKEAEIVTGIIKGQVFVKQEASEANFRKNCGNYRIIHLATHTIIDEQNPSFSKLLFAPKPDSVEDNQLNAYEISNLKLNASLIVLNSCNTGLGKILSGEGVFSLARGFLSAGIPSMVITLWEAEDETSSELMELFYKKIKKGIPVDEALWMAKKEYLKKADRLRSHPYFWSSYVSIGKSQEVILNKSPYIQYGFILIILSLLSIGGIFLYRHIIRKA